MKEHIEGYDVDTLELTDDWGPSPYAVDIAGRVKFALENMQAFASSSGQSARVTAAAIVLLARVPSEKQRDVFERVKRLVDSLHQVAHPKGIDLDVYDHAISEALCQMAKDIRCGKRTEVEYLGTFQARDGVLTTPTNRAVEFTPEPLLIERWPVELERVA